MAEKMQHLRKGVTEKMDIIKAINLKKYYTSDTYEVRALDGVSLTVEEGEFNRARSRYRGSLSNWMWKDNTYEHFGRS